MGRLRLTSLQTFNSKHTYYFIFVTCRVVTCSFVPCRVVSCRVLSCHVTAWPVVLCPALIRLICTVLSFFLSCTFPFIYSVPLYFFFFLFHFSSLLHPCSCQFFAKLSHWTVSHLIYYAKSTAFHELVLQPYLRQILFFLHGGFILLHFF